MIELLLKYGITPEVKEKLDKKNNDLDNLQKQIDTLSSKIKEQGYSDKVDNLVKEIEEII